MESTEAWNWCDNTENKKAKYGDHFDTDDVSDMGDQSDVSTEVGEEDEDEFLRGGDLMFGEYLNLNQEWHQVTLTETPPFL
jgi:hypothetical protein